MTEVLSFETARAEGRFACKKFWGEERFLDEFVVEIEDEEHAWTEICREVSLREKEEAETEMVSSFLAAFNPDDFQWSDLRVLVAYLRLSYRHLNVEERKPLLLRTFTILLQHVARDSTINTSEMANILLPPQACDRSLKQLKSFFCNSQGGGFNEEEINESWLIGVSTALDSSYFSSATRGLPEENRLRQMSPWIRTLGYPANQKAQDFCARLSLLLLEAYLEGKRGIVAAFQHQSVTFFEVIEKCDLAWQSTGFAHSARRLFLDSLLRGRIDRVSEFFRILSAARKVESGSLHRLNSFKVPYTFAQLCKEAMEDASAARDFNTAASLAIAVDDTEAIAMYSSKATEVKGRQHSNLHCRIFI